MTTQGKVLLFGNHQVVMCRLVVKENFLFRLLLRLLYFCKWSYETLLLQASSNKAIPCSCSTNEAKSSRRLSGVREEKGALLHPALDPTRRIISISIKIITKFWEQANMRYPTQVTQGSLGSWQLCLFRSQKQCCPYLRCYLRLSIFKGDEEIVGAQVARWPGEPVMLIANS